MHLTIDGQARQLEDIRTFRDAHNLPESFGVALFEPKDYTGLGSIEQAGNALNSVRKSITEFVPERLPIRQMVSFLGFLAMQFRSELYRINERVGLRDMEIDFAVNGFDAVNNKVFYALVRNKSQPLEFMAIYGEWLGEETRVSQQVHEYPHQNTLWRIHILNNPYGRIGLRVDTGAQIHYLQDESLACPAAGFMVGLMQDVANRIAAAVEF